MQGDRSSGCQGGHGSRSTTVDEDTRIQCEVLHLALEVFPEIYTKHDLIREIATDPDEFGQRDGVLRAIRDLAKIGLLNCAGPLVVPSRAAIRFDLLDEG